MKRREFLRVLGIVWTLGIIPFLANQKTKWEKLSLAEKKIILSRWRKFKSLPEAKQRKILVTYQAYREKMGLC